MPFCCSRAGEFLAGYLWVVVVQEDDFAQRLKNRAADAVNFRQPREAESLLGLLCGLEPVVKESCAFTVRADRGEEEGKASFVKAVIS